MQYVLELAMEDQAGIGEIEVMGSSMASCYFADREATEKLFTEDGWVHTGDLGKIDEGKLVLAGRIKEVLILNAMKYPCGLVEDIARRIPGVSSAYAIQIESRGGTSETSYFDVVIALDPASTSNASLAVQLSKAVGSGFGMRPHRVIVFPQDRIPRTSLGKVSRLALAAQVAGELANPGAGIQVFVASQQASAELKTASALEARLHALWSEVLGHGDFCITDNFFYIGGHSLLAVRLISLIQETFGQCLPLSALFQAPTVQALAKLLRRKDIGSAWYSLIPIQPRGLRPPLFGIHLLDFQDLSHCLGSEQPVYGLRYGMGDAAAGRVLSLPAIEELASHYIDEMRKFQPEGPYFLMGHSFGGVVAYEMAQQLTAKGEMLGLLALFDSYISDGGSTRATPWQVLSNIRRMGGSELLRRAQRKLGKLRAVSREGREKTTKAWASNYTPHVHVAKPTTKLLQAYQPRPSTFPVMLFKSVTPSVLYKVVPPEVGWRKYALRGLEVEDVPGGDHRTILFEPHVRVLAEKLCRAMDGAMQPLGKAE
jgi:thioesterase domain-containing protein/acyl carrier protein